MSVSHKYEKVYSMGLNIKLILLRIVTKLSQNFHSYTQEIYTQPSQLYYQNKDGQD